MMMILGMSSSTLVPIIGLAIFWSMGSGGICRKNTSQGAVEAFVLQHHSALVATVRRPSNQQLLQQRPKGRYASRQSSSDDGWRSQNAASTNKKQVQPRRQQQARRPHPTRPWQSNSNNPSIQINKKMVELGRQRDWEGLLELMMEEKRSFNNVNCATLMSQLGRIRSFNKSDPRFLAYLNALAQIIEKRGLPWIQVRELSNIIHAIAKMQLKNQSTEKILHWISSRAEVTSQFVEEGTAQAVNNIAWAFATLGYDAPTLFAEIEERSSWLVEEGNQQEVSNTAWAFAKLGYDAPKLFAEIEQESSWLVEKGKPQDISNTAWAFAELGYGAPKLFAEIEERSSWLIENEKPQAVSNTAWAFAKLGYESPKLFAEIEERSSWLIEEGTAQDISNTAWAFATLGYDAPELFAEIKDRSSWLIEEGNPQAVANTAWAFAKLGYDAPKLFAEIEKQTSWLVEKGSPQAVANTAWAFATLGYDARKLFAAIEGRSSWLVEEWNLQEVANTCYAVAVLGLTREHETLLRQLWRRGIYLCDTRAHFDDKVLFQLAQIQIFAQADGIILPVPPEILLKKLNEVLDYRDENKQSRASKKISQFLNEVGFNHKVEVAPHALLSSDMLAIDIACTGTMVAIEFDGPTHFLKSLRTGEPTNIENGSTKAKRRYLQQLGWKVINLDYRNYMQAEQNANEKQWLYEKLNNSNINGFS